MINWKTTLGGVATILTSLTAIVTMLQSGHIDTSSLITQIGMIAGGTGLIFAKDHNVTGGTTPNA